MDKNKVLANFDQIESVLKAQIVGGPNSDPGSWAGSTASDEDFPNVAPNGTDYEPKPSNRLRHQASNRGSGPRTRKSVKDFSDDELARELSFRKSGAPNPIQADIEIMSTVPDVVKAVCPDCGGNALHKGTYCGTCNNLGTIYQVQSNDSARMIKSIQHKWNIHKIDESYWKSQNVNTGGGVDEADTTPKNKNNYRDEVEDHTGEMVAKGEQMAEDMEAMADKMADKMDDMEDSAKSAKDMDDDEKMEKMMEDMDKCNKGIQAALRGLSFVAKRQTALMKGAILSAGMTKSMAIEMADMSGEIDWIAEQIQKGEMPFMDEEEEQESKKGMDHDEEAEEMGKSRNARRSRGPARGPQAYGPGLQVIQKSFSDRAPGQDVTGPAQGGSQNGLDHNYDFDTLRKAATYMGVKRMINRRDAMSLDTGMYPTEKVEKSLVNFLDKNDGVVPPLN